MKVDWAARRWRTYLIIGEGSGGTFYQAFDVTMPGLDACAATDERWSRRCSGASTAPRGSRSSGASRTRPTSIRRRPRRATVVRRDRRGEDGGADVVGPGRRADRKPGRHLRGARRLGLLPAQRRAARQPRRRRRRPVVLPARHRQRRGHRHDSVGNDGFAERPTTARRSPAGCMALKNALQMDPVATGPSDSRFITKAYLGDLDGKVWRFDLTTNSGGEDHRRPTKLYAAGKDHPLFASMATVAVGTQQYVFFGTGSDLLPAPGVSGTYKLFGCSKDRTRRASPTSLNHDRRHRVGREGHGAPGRRRRHRLLQRRPDRVHALCGPLSNAIRLDVRGQRGVRHTATTRRQDREHRESVVQTMAVAPPRRSSSTSTSTFGRRARALDRSAIRRTSTTASARSASASCRGGKSVDGRWSPAVRGAAPSPRDRGALPAVRHAARRSGRRRRSSRTVARVARDRGWSSSILTAASSGARRGRRCRRARRPAAAPAPAAADGDQAREAPRPAEERRFSIPAPRGLAAYRRATRRRAARLPATRAEIPRTPTRQQPRAGAGPAGSRPRRSGLRARDRQLPSRWAYRFNHARALGLAALADESVAGYREPPRRCSRTTTRRTFNLGWPAADGSRRRGRGARGVQGGVRSSPTSRRSGRARGATSGSRNRRRPRAVRAIPRAGAEAPDARPRPRPIRCAAPGLRRQRPGDAGGRRRRRRARPAELRILSATLRAGLQGGRPNGLDRRRRRLC